MLDARGVEYCIIDAYKNEPLPRPGEYDAIIILGGPDSANDQTEKILNQLKLIRQALAQSVPCLGICLGMQLLVKATGGRAMKARQPEMGFTDSEGRHFYIEATNEGQQDPIFANLSVRIPVFQVHYDTVELGADMQLLATGKSCRNQIVKVKNNAYGIQFHFEVLPDVLYERAANDPDLMPIGQEKLMADFDVVREEYLSAGKKLFNNFIQIAGIV